MTTVYNHSKLQVEKAKWEKCPRCKGFGAVAFDEDDAVCICSGWGNLWVSTTGSGYVRAKGRKLDKSECY